MAVDALSQRQENPDVHAIKKRLMDYRDTEREIEFQIERLERLEAKMYSVGSPVLSDMPKSPSIAKDRIGTMVAQKEELEKRVRSLRDQQAMERNWIYRILSNVKKADERAVIEMRYIDGEEWHDVCRMLYGRAEDFVDKEDSYMRRATKLHGRALVNISILMKAEASA